MKESPEELLKWYLSQSPAKFLWALRSDLIGYISNIKKSAELISEDINVDEASEDTAELLKIIISASNDMLLLRDIIGEYAAKLDNDESKTDY